jgi:hypothetical protein
VAPEKTSKNSSQNSSTPHFAIRYPLSAIRYRGFSNTAIGQGGVIGMLVVTGIPPRNILPA